MRNVLSSLLNPPQDRPPLQISLKSLLIMPLLAQIVIVTSITGWLAHRNGQHVVEELAYQLSEDTGESLQHQLKAYTAIPPLVTQQNVDALDLQQIDPTNLRSWIDHLLRQSQRFPDVTYIYYGNAQGEYVELHKLPDDRLEFAIKDSQTGKHLTIYQITPDGKVGTPITAYHYDPRPRPWYQAAETSGRSLWTEVYEFTGPDPQLGISFVRPYFDANRTLQGVFGTDFTVSAITQFLEGLKPTPSSETFIMEPDGTIIASSERSAPLTAASPSSLKSRSPNPLIQSTVERLLAQSDRLNRLPINQWFSFRSAGNVYWVQVTPFAEDYGLSWFGVSVLPESDFTAQIRANSRNTVLLCLFALVISTGVSWVLARWINQPIVRLGLASQAIARGETHQSIKPSLIQELNLLVQSFNCMDLDLAQSRSQLEAYSQQLEALVDQRTQALRQSEERWQLALKGNNDGIWDWNIAQAEVFYSARWKTMLGYAEDELVNHKNEWESRLHPDDRERVLQATQAHLDRKTPYFVEEYRLRCKDGQYKWILDRGQALWDEAGNPVRMAGSHTDISDRKQVEEQLRQSEAKLTVAQRIAHVGNWEIDLRTKKTIWSAELLRMFGFNPNDPPPSYPQAFRRLHPDDQPLWNQLWRRLLTTGAPYEADLRVVLPNGDLRYIEGRGRRCCG